MNIKKYFRKSKKIALLFLTVAALATSVVLVSPSNNSNPLSFNQATTSQTTNVMTDFHKNVPIKQSQSNQQIGGLVKSSAIKSPTQAIGQMGQLVQASGTINTINPSYRLNNFLLKNEDKLNNNIVYDLTYLSVLMDQLTLTRTEAIAIASSASVAAAGYYAAIWFFGISGPAAVAATFIAAAATNAAQVLLDVLTKYQNVLQQWNHQATSVQIEDFINSVRKDVLQTLNHLVDAIKINSWAFLPSLAILGTVEHALDFWSVAER